MLITLWLCFQDSMFMLSMHMLIVFLFQIVIFAADLPNGITVQASQDLLVHIKKMKCMYMYPSRVLVRAVFISVS